MSIADQIRKEGEIRGIEKVALNMLASNMSVDVISNATRLSQEEIEKLKKEFH